MCIEITDRRTKAVRHVPLAEARTKVARSLQTEVKSSEPIVARFAAIFCAADKTDTKQCAYVGPRYNVRLVAE